MFCGNDYGSPYFMIWPERDFWDNTRKCLPFAISPQGVQVPHPDGSHTMITLREISELVKKTFG